MLNPHNIMDYFMERTNPFYDRTCNNEVLRMQRANPEQLGNMVGVEYCLLYVQEPILYVVRKQHRSSPSHVVPIDDYYIIAGIVHQAPDLASVLSSRLLSAVTHLQSAFEEARGYAKYHPSRGYWWDFSSSSTSVGGNKGATGKKHSRHVEMDRGNSGSLKKKRKGSKKNKKNEETGGGRGMNEPSSIFQRKRVDMLLDFWVRKFPPKIASAQGGPQPTLPASNAPSQVGEKGDEIKSEKDVKSEKPSDQGSNAGFEGGSAAGGRGIKREAPGIKQEHKKMKLS